MKNIVHNGKPLSGFEDQLNTHSSVTVFYWSQDSTCATPLFVKLGNGGDYYITTDGNSWGDASGYIKTHGLLEILDGMNCNRNQAHRIDVSQRSTYQCVPNMWQDYYCSY